MKQKELKDLAKRIAKAEKILQSNLSNEEKQKAQDEIWKLSSKVKNIEDLDALDEMIQQLMDA